MSHTARSEDPAPYNISGDTTSDDATIAAALSILERRMRTPGVLLDSVSAVCDYLTLRLAEKEHEVFAVLFLDARHCVLSYEEMFRGTLTQTSVYPREVVKRALELNAAAVIFAHNHPSGNPDPSNADRALTRTLTSALSLIDVRALDHFIIGGMKTESLAQLGLM